MPDKTDQILVHLEYLRRGQDESNDHLRDLNDRMRKGEYRLVALETRADDARAAGAKSGGIVGGLIAAGSMIWHALKGWP